MIEQLIKKYNFKLDILLLLSNEETVDTSFLMEHFNVPRTTLKKAIADLNTDFENSDDFDCQILQNKNYQYFIHSATNTPILTNYYQLKFNYLQESLHFQLLTLLITTPRQTVYEIGTQLNISTSYCYRIFKDLNLFLSKFTLSIVIDKQTNIVAFNGKEHIIRTFCFLLLDEAFPITEWPFTHITKEKLTAQLTRRPLSKLEALPLTQRNRLLKLIAINDLRVKKNKYISMDNSQFLDISNLLIDDNLYKEEIIANYRLPEQTKNTELFFFNLLERVFISDIFPKENKLAIGKVIATSSSSFLADINLLEADFSETFHLSKTEDIKYEFLYYLTIYKLFLKFIDIQVDSFLAISDRYAINFFDNPHIDSTSIQEFLTIFFEDNKAIISEKGAQLNFESTCYILYSLLQVYSDTKLSIYFQLSKNLLTERILVQKIKDFFNPSSLTITENIADSTIIISDMIDTEIPGKKYFYIYNEHQREELMLFILNQLMASSS